MTRNQQALADLVDAVWNSRNGYVVIPYPQCFPARSAARRYVELVIKVSPKDTLCCCPTLELLDTEAQPPDTWFVPFLTWYTTHVRNAARARSDRMFWTHLRCADAAKLYAERYATFVPQHYAPLPLDQFTHHAALAEYPRLFNRLAVRIFQGGQP